MKKVLLAGMILLASGAQYTANAGYNQCVKNRNAWVAAGNAIDANIPSCEVRRAAMKTNGGKWQTGSGRFVSPK